MKKCRTKYCRGAAHGNCRSPYCAKCRTHRFKEKFPLKYSFNLLRARARQRGKAFSLVFKEYKAFAIRTDYAKLKGKTSLSLSIDRKDNREGYHWWNIQAITLRENSRKDHAPRLKAWQEETMAQAEAENKMFAEQQAHCESNAC